MRVDPVVALREIGFWLERSRADTYRVQAYRKAADAVAALSGAERARRERDASWGEVAGIGPKTATVIKEAVAGGVPDYLAGLREAGATPLADGGELIKDLRGDLHTHTTWSDGGSPLEEMVEVARGLGLTYLAITDHSPRLKVARGLSAERLTEQIGVIDSINAELAGEFRVLRGIEVDILDDGDLDQDRGLLDRLDVVVSSVHSKLRMDSESMTHRMVGAIANPPDRLLELARDSGCLFSIDTDAHAPGQLDFRVYGAERAVAAGIEPDRIVDTWPVDRLLEWAGAKKQR